MLSSGMEHCVTLVRTDVSEECITSIKVKRISELRSMLQLLVTADIVPSLLILFILMMEAICSSETSVLTIATQCHIPEEGIHQRWYC
jgi:hypothetical protein